MEKAEQQKLAGDWIALHKLPSEAQGNRALFWAFEKMSELSQESPDECWDVVLEILHEDDNAKVLSNLAAGPLEDLLVAHGDEIIKKVEKQALEDDSFRRLLGGVWQNAIADDIWQRVQAVSGPRW